MHDPDGHFTIAKAQHDERLARAKHEHTIKRCSSRTPMSQRIARLVGRALLHLSTRLLRYGQAEQPTLLRLDPTAQRRSSWN